MFRAKGNIQVNSVRDMGEGAQNGDGCAPLVSSGDSFISQMLPGLDPPNVHPQPSQLATNKYEYIYASLHGRPFCIFCRGAKLHLM